MRAVDHTGPTGAARWAGPGSADFEAVISEIAAGAAERDAQSPPAFPEGSFRALARSGLLSLPVPEPVEGGARRASFAEEWRELRGVAKADGSVGRIFDGHLNGVERVAALAPEPLRSRELEAVAAGELRLGVWGADPIPGEGEPAYLVRSGTGFLLEGVKTFCSGSTGLDRALVLARGPDGEPGPPLLAYVDLSEGIEVDRTWFRGAGMRASESHRVVFRRAPVLAVLGEPGELTREPYFARDAIRTAVTWAGIADTAVDSALGTLAAKSAGREPDEVVSLAAGRMLAAQKTIDRWLEHAAREADGDPGARAIGGRIELMNDGTLPQGLLDWHAERGARRRRETPLRPRILRHHRTLAILRRLAGPDGRGLQRGRRPRTARSPRRRAPRKHPAPPRRPHRPPALGPRPHLRPPRRTRRSRPRARPLGRGSETGGHTPMKQ